MSSPVDERRDIKYHTEEARRNNSSTGTAVDSTDGRGEEYESEGHLKVEIFPTVGDDTINSKPSPSQTREQSSRLDDELRMLQIERQVSQLEERKSSVETRSRSRSEFKRERSRRDDPIDDFDAATNPLHERAQIYKPPERPSTIVGKFFKRIHNSSFLVRYFMYIAPLALILLIPILLGAYVFRNASVGGVKMQWFCTWLEIVWLSLWAGRVLAKCLPWPIGLISSLFTNNHKKWRDMGKQLELPATLFFWWLAIFASFLPTMRNHDVDKSHDHRSWQNVMNKVLISIFIAAVLNFFEKIIIQLIAISFHLRTYQDRIEINRFQIDSLTKLYTYSRAQLSMEDSDFEIKDDGQQGGSGTVTPGVLVQKAQENTKHAFKKFGDFSGKIAGDFTGKKIVESSHPSQVCLALLNNPQGSQVLARRLYRTFARQDTEMIHQEDLTQAFENQDEADAAFSMFDKDMNGDISMEELEAVCVEIGRERKSILASLKDLDSVVSKLDDCFTFIVFIIFILVLVSLISTSAQGVLTSMGAAVLALSWLFSATAQEFLQSLIFVFVKHPFDVGDRVTIYGSTGSELTGDDYFVKEIALLYTEFKKMEGHVVQAPNSYLNTLFILNQRRSGGLAEALPMTFKFGTSLEQIDGLRAKLLDFVQAEKREYQGKILTELREITDAHSITLNIVFFFKSNWQNELLRLQRRNKFLCALMVSMQEMGIEGPNMRFPGQKESFPVYMQNIPYSAALAGRGGHPDNPAGLPKDTNMEANQAVGEPSRTRTASSSGGSRRRRGESISAMGHRLDFTLGMGSMSAGDLPGDSFESENNDKKMAARIPINVRSPSRTSGEAKNRRSSNSAAQDIGRSTSRSATFGPGAVHRSNTEGVARTGSLHRNRFFGRKSHDTERMEAGMAGIPENETYQMSEQPAHLDPRTGTISPQAIRNSTDSRSAGQPTARDFVNQEMKRL